MQLGLTLTAVFLSGAGASISGRCCCFEEPVFDAGLAAFEEGSTACIGPEGKMLRVSACTREEEVSRDHSKILQ
jgi:hypothetical protein